jgi:putative tryptophan/tyrosine transport system substrate-binding protein
MGRRLIAGACASVLMSVAAAQPRIGVISMGVDPSSPVLEALRQGLRDHGYVEGRNITIEYRFAQGHADRLPALALELVALKPALIVTEGTPTAVAVKKATTTIPVVMAFGSDPVKAGLAVSLARPGGNITGVVGSGADRTLKQFEVLREVVPQTKRVAVIHNPTRSDMKEILAELTETARSLNVVLQLIPVRSPKELEQAFKTVAAGRSDALMTIGHGMLFNERKRIADFALKSRLPGVFPEREFVDEGGLMAYGPDLAANFRRAAGYVDKILKGAKPGDLPIEQPTKWGLVVNLRTAKTLGIKMPGSILVRADELIQ